MLGRNILSSGFRLQLLAGAVSGLVGGLLFAWAMQEQGMTVAVTGLLGLPSTGFGLAVHLALAGLFGAGFAAVFGFQPESYAPTLAFGLLYGLLWWIVGPMTLKPILDGDSPSWSLTVAVAAFPSLVGHLLYGGVTALGLYALMTALARTLPERAGTPSPARPRARIVILGGGFGGLACAQRLEELALRATDLDVTLVSQSNYLLFTPMLAEVASSGLEAQHISAPVRAACRRTRFLRGEVEAIDTADQMVSVQTAAGGPPERLPYDHLVLAVGSVPNFHGLPGLAEHSFRLKTLQDAADLRNHVIAALEHADVETDPEERRRRLTFVVAGAGFAGTELVAELLDLARDVARYYPNVGRMDRRFVLVHSGDRILPEMSPELAGYALGKLQGRGIEVLLGRRVSAATAEAVRLNDGSEIPTRTLVWTAGNQPNPVVGTLPCARNRGGQVVTDAALRVEGLENVWAVGDCAEVPDILNDDKPCPPTAQHALRQGKLVAENVAAALRQQPAKPFRFRTIGLLVVLGRRTAAAEIRGRRFSGLLAWLMWRSVYLSKLPGLEKKVRVALDWTLDLFFPRDVVLTSGAPTPTVTELIDARSEEDRR